MKSNKKFFLRIALHKLSIIIIAFSIAVFAGCSAKVGKNIQPEVNQLVVKQHDKDEKAVLEEAKEQMPSSRPLLTRSKKMCSDMASGTMSIDEGYIQHNTEAYDYIAENEFKSVIQNPLSTFSIDVDTASYSNVRRFIRYNQLPPKDAVRIEEMINYFSYDYPQPAGKDPFSITTEMSQCPWNRENRLIHIGLQGRSLDYKNIKPNNLVFLIDSSGSMSDHNKLPLLKKSLGLLLNELSSRDRIAIVAYAGSAGLVLKSTQATRKELILASIDQLHAGGSTAGGEGIQLAYRVAKQNIITNGNNRVILCTDGDFNVGQSSAGEMVRLIEEKRKDDIFLTICGFGMGNYKDSMMEQISNAGNGNYFYIDSIREAEKVFVHDMRANMFTIAKDVKIQIEFNPAKIKAYRLVGYENRILNKEDFNNDKKDAGELGAGHTVTALYEIVPAGSVQKIHETDELKYQKNIVIKNTSASDEIMTVKLRYKAPKSETSVLVSSSVTDNAVDLKESTDNFRFSAAVAGFGMILRDSPFKKELTFNDVLVLAKGSKGKDAEGYRAEFVGLVETCALLKK